MEICINLKNWLQIRGMTQKELALRTGLREATISEMVHNERTVINKDHLLLVMNALHIEKIEDILVIVQNVPFYPHKN